MINIKKILALLAVFASPFVVMAQQQFSIHGKVSKSNAASLVYLSYETDEVRIQDSTRVTNGEFWFSGKLGSPVIAVLSLQHKKEPRDKIRDMLQFFLEPAKITIATTDSIKRANILGSKLNDENHELSERLKAVEHELTLLMRKYPYDISRLNDSSYQQAQKQIGLLSVERKKITDDFIDSHRDSHVALAAFAESYTSFGFDPVPAEKEFMKFSLLLRRSELGKSIEGQISAQLNTQLGQKARDFTQSDINGKSVSLSSYRGKYVLLDFWASWCAPCRAENPNVLKAYNQFKGRNLEVIAVSLDEKVAAWKTAVEKDGLPWIQLCDLKGWRNEVARLYGIQGVPQNFLIDPNGLIIAKDLRGNDLQKKLSLLIK